MTMPLTYQHLQMELEGILLDHAGLLVRAHPAVDDFPLLLNVHTADGLHRLYWDADLPPDVADSLARQDPADVDVQAVQKMLARCGRPVRLEQYVTYTAPPRDLAKESAGAVCLAGDDPRLRALGFDGMAKVVYVWLKADAAVAACVSVRQNARAAEAWVCTAPDFRRRGLARRVVAAWACGMLDRGLIPFYSHAVTNMPSARLARSLGFIRLFELSVLEDV